jgi:tRNA (uracil-5-)-methyltransferase TRM9
MQKSTIVKLNNLNQKFYNEVGSTIWNQSPTYYWQGWFGLLPIFLELYKAKNTVILSKGGSGFGSPELASPRQAKDPHTIQDKVQTKINILKINKKETLSESENKNSQSVEDKVQINSGQTPTKQSQIIKFLDIGCGNARFANFLGENIGDNNLKNISYTGIDFSVSFLGQSNILKAAEFANFELLELDIINEIDILIKKETMYECIVLFGVIHHIPSHSIRQEFLQKISELLSQNGILIFTTWEYTDSTRLSRRIVDKKTADGQKIFQKLAISPEELEIGDNVLDWIKGIESYRYSHSFTESEVYSLIQNANLELVRTFYNDGRSSKRNKYYVCQNSD